MNLGVETMSDLILVHRHLVVSAFSDESWGGDQVVVKRDLDIKAFQHSLMNLGVETSAASAAADAEVVFQHSLMNLGVETLETLKLAHTALQVSAFSDESWGGDRQKALRQRRRQLRFSIL